MLIPRRSRSWLPEPFGSTGEGASLDRGEDEPARETAALRLSGSKDLWTIRRTTIHGADDGTDVGWDNRECRAVNLYGLYSAFRLIDKANPLRACTFAHRLLPYVSEWCTCICAPQTLRRSLPSFGPIGIRRDGAFALSTMAETP